MIFSSARTSARKASRDARVAHAVAHAGGGIKGDAQFGAFLVVSAKIIFRPFRVLTDQFHGVVTGLGNLFQSFLKGQFVQDRPKHDGDFERRFHGVWVRRCARRRAPVDSRASAAVPSVAPASVLEKFRRFMDVLPACFGPSSSRTAPVCGEKKSLTHDGQPRAAQAYATVAPLTTGFLPCCHRHTATEPLRYPGKWVTVFLHRNSTS